MGQGWMVTPADKYGGSLNRPATATPDATAVTPVAPVVVPAMSGIASPRDPMFWFAVLAAGTVGLMAYSTVQVK
jgi:hypothetical protein